MAKCLYCCAVGDDCRTLVAETIKRFEEHGFDFLIFSYGDNQLTGAPFNECEIITEKGQKWHFAKTHLTAERTSTYEHIFYWDDDIEIESFDVANYLEIIKRNDLQLSQPALTSDSHVTWPIVKNDKNYAVGRLTDFIEIMVPVFNAEGWNLFREMLVEQKSPTGWGWGYDLAVRDGTGIKRLGIVDAEQVAHRRPLRGGSAEAHAEMNELLQKPGIQRARMITVAPLI